MRAAVFISGQGSNMVKLIEASQNMNSPFEVNCVISDNKDAPGLELAGEMDVKPIGIRTDSMSGFESIALKLLAERKIELICLAGFMRILSPEFVQQWENRIVNIHPSLLPSYKGLHTHRRVLEAGDRIHGCTVHFVNEELDAGQIIMQGAVPVHDTDDENSLRERVQQMEHMIYPMAVAAIAQRHCPNNPKNEEIWK